MISISIFITCETEQKISEYSTGGKVPFCEIFVSVLHVGRGSGWVKCISSHVPDFNFLNLVIYVNAINLYNKGLLSTCTITSETTMCWCDISDIYHIYI